MGTVIGGLLMPQFKPYDVGGTLEQANRIAGAQTTNQTNLLTLADLKAKQAAEAVVFEQIKNNPEVARQLFGGGPVLGSLMQPQAPPGAGPITQSPPGGGPAQQIPAYPDASRYANVPPASGGPIPPGMAQQLQPQVTPPQSTIASLGPAGQPQMQAPQNPVLEMARTDPRAAMLLQQQIQGRQLNQLTMQEKQLDIGVKVAEGVARQMQNVTDQASLDEARARLQQIHPQAAAQLPQFYNTAAIEALQQRGIAMADQAKNRHLIAQSRLLDVQSEHLPKLLARIGDEDTAAPTGGAAPTSTVAPTTGQQARTAPPEYESAIAEANRLYPQVKPERIKAIIAAESNFDAKAVSPAGAKGPMQLMDGTAKDMGVDDPFNVQQNVRGGTRYYAQLLTKYGGDERKALAAYNWGPGNLDKVGGDVSKAPAETQAYVNRVLGGGGGSTTGTAQAPATDPRIAQLETKIAQRERDAQAAAALGNESLATQFSNNANRLKDERTRVLAESQRQQERAEEIPREVKKQEALTEARQNLERQRQAGPLLPEERRKHLAGLRENVLKEPTFKIYQDVRNGYQNVKVGAASDSAQGDLAIFNGLAKILDPTSSVMSGEARNIEEAQGQLQIWFNSPAKFLEGDRISKENRPRFLKMAYDLAREKLTTAQTELKSVWGPLAQEVGLDFNQVVPLPDLTPLGPGPNVSKLDKLINK